MTTAPITKLFWVVVTGVPVIKTGTGITNVVFPNPSDIKAAILLRREGYSIREIMRFLEYKSPRSVSALLEKRS